MSWFKNLIIYRLTKEVDFSLLETQLAQLSFTPCSNQDRIKIGWVSPFHDQHGTFTHIHAHHILLCLSKEEKQLPASVVKRVLDQKQLQQEELLQRKLKKTEKESLKDEVIFDLLPRAFSRFTQTAIWINRQDNLIIIDSASTKRAEEALSFLRKTLGSLPVTPVNVTRPVELTLTNWLSNGDLPPHFALGEEAELRETQGDGAILKCKNQDLQCDEIINHLTTGKHVTKLALAWSDKIQCILYDDLSLHRVKYSDTLKEQNQDISKEDKALRLDAEFVLVTSELSSLLTELLSALEPQI